MKILILILAVLLVPIVSATGIIENIETDTIEVDEKFTVNVEIKNEDVRTKDYNVKIFLVCESIVEHNGKEVNLATEEKIYTLSAWESKVVEIPCFLSSKYDNIKNGEATLSARLYRGDTQENFKKCSVTVEGMEEEESHKVMYVTIIIIIFFVLLIIFKKPREKIIDFLTKEVNARSFKQK